MSIAPASPAASPAVDTAALDAHVTAAAAVADSAEPLCAPGIDAEKQASVAGVRLAGKSGWQLRNGDRVRRMDLGGRPYGQGPADGPTGTVLSTFRTVTDGAWLANVAWDGGPTGMSPSQILASRLVSIYVASEDGPLAEPVYPSGLAVGDVFGYAPDYRGQYVVTEARTETSPLRAAATANPDAGSYTFNGSPVLYRKLR